MSGDPGTTGRPGAAGRRDRLLAAAARIRATAPLLPDEALTDPDPETGERWDRRQLLAHVAEMLPYWVEQVEVVAAGDDMPFGRVSSDPGRLAAIERDRREDPSRLLDRVDDGVGVVLALLERLDDDALARSGRHQTLGAMTVAAIVDRFLVEHLEEHADQLDAGSAVHAGG
jgi:DinB superfamily